MLSVVREWKLGSWIKREGGEKEDPQQNLLTDIERKNEREGTTWVGIFSVGFSFIHFSAFIIISLLLFFILVWQKSRNIIQRLFFVFWFSKVVKPLPSPEARIVLLVGWVNFIERRCKPTDSSSSSSDVNKICGTGCLAFSGYTQRQVST